MPIYNTVKEATDATAAKMSILFVPAKFFLGAAKEALEAGIKLLVSIPEHVPVRDTLDELARYVEPSLDAQKRLIALARRPAISWPEL